MYKDILDEMRYSFSRVHQYEECPFAFYLSKIEESDDGEGNYYAEVGSFMHTILQMIFDKELSIDDACDYFINHYDENVFYKVKESTMDKKYYGAIDYLANFDETIFDRYDIVGVEKEVKFKIENHEFIGYIDLLLRDKETEKLVLVDHKSTGHFLKKNGEPLKNQIESFTSYSRQMYLYCKAIYEEYKEYPEKIVWNHFFEQQITDIPFNENNYVSAIAWAMKTINKIYTDNKFNARTDFFRCSTICDFRNSCPYWAESREE